MNVSCESFERWLDEGRPAATEAAPLAHAASCARCASLLELETLLAAPVAGVTRPGFTQAVLRRMHAPARAAAWSPRGMFPAPVWVQGLLDPLVALALTALALLGFARHAVWTAGSSLAAQWRVLTWPDLRVPDPLAAVALRHAFAGLGASPGLTAALLVGLAPALLLLSWQLYRVSERWVAGAWDVAPRAPGAHAAAR